LIEKTCFGYASPPRAKVHINELLREPREEGNENGVVSREALKAREARVMLNRSVVNEDK